MQNKVSLQFTEEMHGFVDLPKNSEISKESFFQLSELAEQKNKYLKFRLTIEIDDIDLFIEDKNLLAKATGTISSSELGDDLPVKEGSFNLFVNPTQSDDTDAAKEMHYVLYFYDQKGNPYTFYGYKVVVKEKGLEVWDETTTLYTRVWEGHTDKSSKIYLKGVLRLNMQDFITQMKTLQTTGGTSIENFCGKIKFANIFAQNLIESYAPFFLYLDEKTECEDYPIPLQSTSGVKNAKIEYHKINTEDGLSISIDRFLQNDSDDVVVLIHGLTTSTDMFIMPEHKNIVQYLFENGLKDVFSIDWRGSNRHIYNLAPHRYSFDDLAMYDFVSAFDYIRKIIGPNKRIHVVAHCVGSIGFMSALSAGKITNISSVISNSVSLHPRVRAMTKVKMTFAPFILEYIFRYPYVSPKIPYYQVPWGIWLSWMEDFLRLFVKGECKEPACHMVSLMWGWGFPAAYEHHNLHPITHRRLKDLFGGTSMNYYRHVRKCLSAGALVKYKTKDLAYKNLPDNYFESFVQKKNPPILFISGSENKIFPKANLTTFEAIKKSIPKAPVFYQEFEGYGHQDTLMGKNADKDIFPSIVGFIKQYSVQGKNSVHESDSSVVEFIKKYAN